MVGDSFIKEKRKQLVAKIVFGVIFAFVIIFAFVSLIVDISSASHSKSNKIISVELTDNDYMLDLFDGYQLSDFEAKRWNYSSITAYVKFKYRVTEGQMTISIYGNSQRTFSFVMKGESGEISAPASSTDSRKGLSYFVLSDKKTIRISGEVLGRISDFRVNNSSIGAKPPVVSSPMFWSLMGCLLLISGLYFVIMLLILKCKGYYYEGKEIVVCTGFWSFCIKINGVTVKRRYGLNGYHIEMFYNLSESEVLQVLVSNFLGRTIRASINGRELVEIE